MGALGAENDDLQPRNQTYYVPPTSNPIQRTSRCSRCRGCSRASPYYQVTITPLVIPISCKHISQSGINVKLSGRKFGVSSFNPEFSPMHSHFNQSCLILELPPGGAMIPTEVSLRWITSCFVAPGGWLNGERTQRRRKRLMASSE